MKPTPSEIKAIKAGQIFQITPGEDHGYKLRLMVAERVESWGIAGYISGVEGSVSRTWNLIEPTGGVIPFARDGKPFALPEPPPKHHE